MLKSKNICLIENEDIYELLLLYNMNDYFNNIINQWVLITDNLYYFCYQNSCFSCGSKNMILKLITVPLVTSVVPF